MTQSLLKVLDAFHVDDRRAMDANEADCVELRFQFVERGAAEHFPASDVQIGVNAGGLDPVDIGNPDEAR